MYLQSVMKKLKGEKRGQSLLGGFPPKMAILVGKVPKWPYKCHMSSEETLPPFFQSFKLFSELDIVSEESLEQSKANHRSDF